MTKRRLPAKAPEQDVAEALIGAMAKVKVSYASCTIFTNTGPMKCPLCGVDVPVSTVHTCSKKES